MASSRAALRRPGAAEYQAKIGIAIFAAGVLVGVIGALIAMKDRAAAVADVAAPATPPSVATKPAAPAKPQAGLNEHATAAAHDGPSEPAEEGRAVRETVRKAREPAALPISSGSAPSCRQLLGVGVVARDDPKAALRETRLANRELRRGNVDEAQAAYCRAFEWHRSNVDRHVNLARLFLVRRDWEKAAEYGQSALALEPKNRPALGVVGDAWAALYRTDEARAAWMAAERMPKTSPSELDLIVRRNMALAKRMERLKDFSLAERLYRRVLLLNAEHTGATKGIASCLMKAGDDRAARAWARRAETLERGE